jgi:5-methyltetrahydrofolate--homocysteine methyltransferase
MTNFVQACMHTKTHKENKMNDVLKNLYDAVLEGDIASVETNLQAALDAKLDPATILNDGMISAMGEVGRLFEEGEYFVPEMLISARAMQAGMKLLRPALASGEIKSAGKIVIGTVKGDLHDIGKNLVGLMLEGAGFEIKDLGVDVPHEDFIRVLQEEKPDIIALSALLTTTMPSMKATIEAIQQAGLRDQVKIMVGGAPVTQEYAAQIGADGYSSDASRAVSLAKSLVGA